MSNLKTQALSNYLRFAVTAAVPFLLTPLMLETLGEKMFGLWSLTQSTVSLFALLDVGLSATLVRYVSATRCREESNEVAGTILTLYLGLSTVACLLLGLAAWWWEPWRSDPQAHLLLWCLGLRAVTFGLPLSILRSTLFAEQVFLTTNLWQAASSLIYGLVAWQLLCSGGSLLQLAALLWLASLLEHAGYFLMLKKIFPRWRFAPTVLNRDKIREMASFSAASTLSTLAGLVLFKTDPLIIAAYLPLQAVATYSVALKLAEGVLMLLKQALNVLTPRFSILSADDDLEGAGKLLILSCRWGIGVGSLVGLPVLVLASEILNLWLGAYPSEAVVVTRILVLSGLISIPQMVASSALTMSGHHNFTARAAGLSVVTNLGLSLALVQPLGLTGVALATLFTTLVIDLGLVSRRACTFYHISPHGLLRSVMIPLILPLTAFTALLLLLKGTSSL